MIRKLPPLKYLRECFLYERSTGKLFWKERPREHFVSNRGWNRWNTRYAKKEAFTSVTAKGHTHGAIDKVLYRTHRVVWKLMTGKEPPKIIDHRDRNGSNNRWRNLREATNGQNRINTLTSKGVHCAKGRWRAYISENNRLRHLGSFGTEHEALLVRRRAIVFRYGAFAP